MNDSEMVIWLHDLARKLKSDDLRKIADRFNEMSNNLPSSLYRKDK